MRRGRSRSRVVENFAAPPRERTVSLARGSIMIRSVSPVLPLVTPWPRSSPVPASRSVTRTPPMLVPMNLASRLMTLTVMSVGSANADADRPTDASRATIRILRTLLVIRLISFRQTNSGSGGRGRFGEQSPRRHSGDPREAALRQDLNGDLTDHERYQASAQRQAPMPERDEGNQAQQRSQRREVKGGQQQEDADCDSAPYKRACHHIVAQPMTFGRAHVENMPQARQPVSHERNRHGHFLLPAELQARDRKSAEGSGADDKPEPCDGQPAAAGEHRFRRVPRLPPHQDGLVIADAQSQGGEYIQQHIEKKDL